MKLARRMGIAVDPAGKVCVRCGATMQDDGKGNAVCVDPKCAATVPRVDGRRADRRALPPELAKHLEEDRLIDMPTVATILGVPLYTAREWSRRGIFPTVKIGRRVLVRAASFHRWLESRESGGDGQERADTHQHEPGPPE